MLKAKQKITAILLAAVLFACMGCRAEEESTAEEAEEMLRSAYDGQALFSNITVELTEIDTDGAGLLKGEIGGIEKTTGKRYYANFESIRRNDGMGFL